MTAVGVDGCRAGWLAIRLQGGQASYRVAAEWDALGDWAGPARTLVDMPMGLSREPRLCDALLRRHLIGRASSVFTPPCRQALAGRCYREASDIQLRMTGRRLTLQSWHLSARIGQLDQWLHERGCDGIHECHPEFCFQQLNGGRALIHGKKSREGVSERLALLQRHPPFTDWLPRVMTEVKRSAAARDDWLDAACLALCASHHDGRLLPDETVVDEAGIPMRIWMPAPHDDTR